MNAGGFARDLTKTGRPRVEEMLEVDVPRATDGDLFHRLDMVNERIGAKLDR